MQNRLWRLCEDIFCQIKFSFEICDCGRLRKTALVCNKTCNAAAAVAWVDSAARSFVNITLYNVRSHTQIFDSQNVPTCTPL
jgi:hypothetical protein